LDLCPSPVQTDRIEVMDNSNVTVSTVQEYDEQQTVITETSPLIQRDQPTYEEPFSGLASFFPYSRTRGCLCCSIA
jgi:hypothetical protein